MPTLVVFTVIWRRRGVDRLVVHLQAYENSH